jgi:hypothetical protein
MYAGHEHTTPCFYLLNWLLNERCCPLEHPYNNSGVYSSSLGGSTVSLKRRNVSFES